MDPDAIANLLGRSADDRVVQEALLRFGVARRPRAEVDFDDVDGPVVSTQDWVSNLSAGIEFGFQTESGFRYEDDAAQIQGGLILTEIYFYGQRPGSRAYVGQLPFGLSLLDDRSTVQRKMDSHLAGRRSYIRDTWDHLLFRVTASYTDSDNRIDFLVCMLRAEAAEDVRATVQRPGLDGLVGMLGRPVDDVMVRRTLGTYGLGRNRRRIGSGEEVDVRRTHGLRLRMRHAERSVASEESTLRLHELEFVREGAEGSRGWEGDLPAGICFDDSPAAALAKVGRPPDNQEDQDFVGQAFWEQDEFSLLIVYSTMENVLLRVVVTAPGIG